MATLEQFLDTGDLGPIHAGMIQAEVIALLGPPQDESVSRSPKTLKYGGLQLSFHKNGEASDSGLQHIGLYFRPPAEPIPEPTRPLDFRGTPETTIAEIRQFLRSVGLKEATAVEDEDGTRLNLPSGAEIVFDGENLDSIHFTARAPNSARKQLALSIAEDTWDQLKALARQSSRSVPQMCSDWIAQRANELQQRNVVATGHRG